ncbi:hypothetical protein Tco_0219193 [Tanacetum coccineum]
MLNPYPWFNKHYHNTSQAKNDSRDGMAEEEDQERKGDPEDTNTITCIGERRDTPLLERKDITDVGNLGSNKDDEGIEWLDVEEPLYLVDTSEEMGYESLINEDDYDRGCRKPSDLEDGFYKDTIKLGPEYLGGMDDE